MTRARDIASSNLPITTSVGNVSSTELQYIDGVTSAVQTQLNTKAVAGSNGMPYRMEAGAGNFGTYNAGTTAVSATITFSANRFTQTPVLTANAANPFNSVYWPIVIRSISNTSAAIAAGGSQFPGQSGFAFWWIAVQMSA